MIPSISLFETVEVVIRDQNIFFSFSASVADAAAVNLTVFKDF